MEKHTTDNHMVQQERSEGTPTLPELLRETRRRLVADEAIPLAGNIAFRIVFSAFPFLIFLTSLAGFFGTEEWAARAVNFLLGVAPQSLVAPLSGEIRNILTVQRYDLMSLGALLTVWSAMGGVDSVRVGLNRAYDVREHRSILHLYLLDIVFVIGSALMMLALAVLIILFPVAIKIISNLAGTLPPSLTHVEQWRYPLAILLLFAGVHVAHRMLPAQRLSWRAVLPGVALTVIVWIGLSAGFSTWLLHFNSFASTYASLSGIFAAMFLVYLAALVLIAGGELNRVLDLVRQGKTTGEISASPKT